MMKGITKIEGFGALTGRDAIRDGDDEICLYQAGANERIDEERRSSHFETWKRYFESQKGGGSSHDPLSA